MGDITFLEDYQYQLKLNELDRNLMEMERLGMEVTNGLMAIHNATVVVRFYEIRVISSRCRRMISYI